ncbi:MAG TPA: PEP-CTERM sorting domain-containing protein [Steroidobacteraceae bacterium]|nr:PEP-CTERM sorting domain-containing protein [Steroidobacteraceae bacterium]
MTDFLQSENFSLLALTNLNSVTFWNLQLSSADYLGSIYWAIQADSAGTPGTIIDSGTTSSVTRVATGLTDNTGTFAEYSNTFDLPLVQLAAGTTYWLTLHDGPLTSTDFADFYWEWSNDFGDGQEFDQIANAGWDSNLAEHAFSLTGVPEPSTVSLLLAALLFGSFGMRKLSASRKN